MIGVDAQTGGVGALLILIAGFIGAAAKGAWAFFRDFRSDRRADAEGREKTNTRFIELSQEGMLTWAKNLETDNVNLRKDNESLRSKVQELTDTVHTQGIRIAEMMERISELESGGGHGPARY